MPGKIYFYTIFDFLRLFFIQQKIKIDNFKKNQIFLKIY